MIVVWKNHARWLVGLGLLSVTLATYWGVLTCDFINYDDNKYLTDNPYVRGGLTLPGLRWAFNIGYAGNWHPLTWLSHMMDWQLFGPAPRWHHLTNLVLHLANTLLLFGLLRRMTGALWRSTMVAALFGLHPLHVESVAWVAERKDLLSTFFFLLTLWAYAIYAASRSTLYAQRSRRFYLLALCSFALALMSKPMAVSLPFILLLLDYWPLKRVKYAAGKPFSFILHHSSFIILDKLPFFALAIGSGAVTVLAQRRGGAVVPIDALPLVARCSNAVVSYLRYAGKLFWPHDLAVIYPYVYHWPVWLAAGAALLLLATSWLALRLRRQAPYFPVGWFWYVVTLVPVIGLVQVGEQAIADRYTYIPSIGFFVMICWAAPQLLAGWPPRRPVLGLTAAAVLCACAVLGRSQVAYWRDSVSLFQHAVAVTHDNGIAHTALGAGLAARNRLDEAIDQYQLALQLNPGYGLAHNNWGLALARLGRYDEAVAHYRSALAINPQDVEAHYNLANALNPEYVDEAAVPGTAPNSRPDIEQSRQKYLSTLALDPAHVGAWINLGNLEASTGNYDAAIRCYQDAIRIDPGSAQAHYNLAVTLANPQVRLSGKHEQIVAHFREALRLKPAWLEAMNNLAWIMATSDRSEVRNGAEAVRLATQACELTRYKNALVLGTLDAAYAEAGRFAEATDTAQRGLDLAVAAGETNLAENARARLKLYQAGKPYREGD
jgi:protein O-mannosyl-transferase